jgi:CDP-diacylglycerol--glycerol-3-phosphate 3-phosphatidyltransferase
VADKPKPLISANMVTSVRLLVMPIMTWLLYEHPFDDGETAGWWWALAIGSVVACTDFVDGYLARKHGPTVLGGMLDPLADKVFVALLYLPIMHVGFVPAWAVGLLFVREFLVTSIRSAYEWRGLQLKTSYFGKVKTWVQMQGILTLMSVMLVSLHTVQMILIASAALPAMAVLYFWVAKRTFLTGSALGVFFASILLLLFLIPDNPQTSVDLAMYIVCAVTWMSGFDYLAGAIPTLRKAGGFHRADIVRVLAAIAIPASAAVALVAIRPQSGFPTFWDALPMLAIVAFELAVGGLDNLLSRHKATTPPLQYSVRTLGASALLLLTLAIPAQTVALAWVAMTISVSGVAWEFWRGRKHYLDDSKWDEELVEG